MLTDFQNSFTGRLTGKFATNSYLNIYVQKNRNALEVIEANSHVRLHPLKKLL